VLDLQLDALRAAGCEHIFSDRTSGARADRPGFRDALADAREGDSVVVWKLDRLSRSLHHLIETVQELERRGVGFRSLTESIDTSSTGGKAIFPLFAALAFDPGTDQGRLGRCTTTWPGWWSPQADDE
jgi:DNA invertase Pin-like site-specific DNA recombinase